MKTVQDHEPGLRESDAETQLDRLLDESSPGKQGNHRRMPAPGNRAHRVVYALPVILVISLVGGVVAYLIATVVVRSNLSTTWAVVLSGFAIAALAWGVSGANRARAVTSSDRFVDIAISAVVASMVLGIVRPTPLDRLFAASIRDDGSFGGRGLDGVPRLHEIIAWSAVGACIAFAAAALLRMLLQRRAAQAS